MLYAELALADCFRCAFCNPTFTFTAAVFGAETLALRGGGAARHRARLVFLSTAVFSAMFISRMCVGAAAIKPAHSLCTMLAAETACYCKSAAAFHLAHFRVATAMLNTPTSCIDGRGTVVRRAEPTATMFAADSTSANSCITASS